MKRLQILVAAASFVAAFAVPASSNAALLPQSASCTGTAQVGPGESVCSTTFTLTEAVYPSHAGTHANFHAKVSTGTVTMRWVNEFGATVASWTCKAPGLYSGVSLPTGTNRVDVGVADASTVPNCTENVTDAVFYARGVQTLIVTAHASDCVEDRTHPRDCPFHGYLQLNPAIASV